MALDSGFQKLKMMTRLIREELYSENIAKEILNETYLER